MKTILFVLGVLLVAMFPLFGGAQIFDVAREYPDVVKEDVVGENEYIPDIVSKYISEPFYKVIISQGYLHFFEKRPPEAWHTAFVRRKLETQDEKSFHIFALGDRWGGEILPLRWDIVNNIMFVAAPAVFFHLPVSIFLLEFPFCKMTPNNEPGTLPLPWWKEVKDKETGMMIFLPDDRGLFPPMYGGLRPVSRFFEDPRIERVWYDIRAIDEDTIELYFTFVLTEDAFRRRDRIEFPLLFGSLGDEKGEEIEISLSKDDSTFWVWAYDGPPRGSFSYTLDSSGRLVEKLFVCDGRPPWRKVRDLPVKIEGPFRILPCGDRAVVLQNGKWMLFENISREEVKVEEIPGLDGNKPLSLVINLDKKETLLFQKELLTLKGEPIKEPQWGISQEEMLQVLRRAMGITER
jgi:hypothetical protein